jgi:hypothetical protein
MAKHIFWGSARVPRAGFGVSPKRTSSLPCRLIERGYTTGFPHVADLFFALAGFRSEIRELDLKMRSAR